MSDMKCPFCGNDTSETIWEEANAETYCPNCDTTGDTKLWQELITTRKALDVAVDALKVYSNESENWWYGYEFQGSYVDTAGETADKALEQINEIKGGINES